MSCHGRAVMIAAAAVRPLPQLWHDIKRMQFWCPPRSMHFSRRERRDGEIGWTIVQSIQRALQRQRVRVQRDLEPRGHPAPTVPAGGRRRERRLLKVPTPLLLIEDHFLRLPLFEEAQRLGQARRLQSRAQSTVGRSRARAGCSSAFMRTPRPSAGTSAAP